MFGTYQRLNLHVMASGRDVVRAASLKLKPEARHDRAVRKERHKFYREMLSHHARERKLYLSVLRGR